MTAVESGRQRTEYSKTGCKECKRRKIKCDEFINPPPGAQRKINHQGRDSCWQCTRLKKACEYPLRGERVPRVSRKVLMEQYKESRAAESFLTESILKDSHKPKKDLIPPCQTSHITERGAPVHTVQSVSVTTPSPNDRSISHGSSLPSRDQTPYHHVYSPVQAVPFGHSISSLTSSGGSQIFYENSTPFPTNTKSFLQNSPSGSVSFKTSMQSSPIDLSYNTPHVYDSSELALLATDLNNLVSDMMVEVNDDFKSVDNGKIQRSLSDVSQEPPPSTESKGPPLKAYNWIPRNIGIGIFNVTMNEKVYLQEFYSGFASIILPFNAYDATQMSYFNPMRDIIFNCAYNESFMLAAILAQGARSLFLKTSNPDDEFAYCKYLSECLELLRPALGNEMEKPTTGHVPDIEAVLLTVLLLTSSNAANSKQNWRPHLKGAKDILLKHAANRKALHNSKLLLFCKYWFISFEILAGLGSKLGGTLESDEELDSLISYSDPYEVQLIKSLGLVSNDGFYLIGGYHLDLVPSLKDLIKLLNRKRRNKNYTPNDTFNYLTLMSHFHHQGNIQFVNHKGILINSDFIGGVIPPGRLLDPITVNNEHLIISWMDTSQQLYCLAALITILTDFFGLLHDSPQVQCLVTRMTSFLSFLIRTPEPPTLIKCSVMMIQWPMLVAGMNSIRKEDQILVLKVFDLALKAGAGSAGHSISRMTRIWTSREAGVNDLVDDNVDVVNY